jgi:ABC-2 type transport system ATP-binding protein
LADHPVAVLEGVSKRYGEVAALEDFSLHIRPGEVLALLGPNGAGKTTSVNLLLGLAKPTSGRVEVFGRPPHTRASRSRVGAMLQISRVPETLRVGELVELFSSYYPSPLAPEVTLAAAGLRGLEKRLFGKLSGGQRQRVLFALALCGDPDLLYLDEPTTGLDIESRRGLWREIRRFVEEGRSVVLTTHYLEEADTLADRIVVLHRGRQVAEGTPEEIKAKVEVRWIRCRTALAEGDIAAMSGVLETRREAETFEILTRQAEPVVRKLLARDPGLSHLEVRGAALDEAFLALTDDNRKPSQEAA